MSIQVMSTIEAMSLVNMWFKVTSGDPLALSDVPSIIPFRWDYFKSEWDRSLKADLESKIKEYDYPDVLAQQIVDFTQFVSSRRNNLKVNPFADISTITEKFYAIFDSIDVYHIPLTRREEELIEAATDKVQNLTREDFVGFKGVIIKGRDEYADKVNGTDEAYNKVYNRGAVGSRYNASIKDLQVIQRLQDSIKVLDFIVANYFRQEKSLVDPFTLAKVNANNPDFDIRTYSSGTLVRMNYGDTLQDLAQRHLGSHERWIEIAIANGLKAPYIDESGETVGLLSNGSGRNINIKGISPTGEYNRDKFFVGQPVILQSNTQVTAEQRFVEDIKEVPVSGDLVITLSGEGDLSRYKVNENSVVRVFKPNTTNSGFFILIPSPEPVEDLSFHETPWFLKTSQQDEKNAGIDLMIGDDGDLKLSNSNDLLLSYGLANIIQALRLKLQVEQGALFRHPDFGLVSVLGSTNIAQESLKRTITESILVQIMSDGRFSGVDTLDVEYFSPSTGNQGASGFNINLVARLAGGEKTVPISFSVNLT